ncbi:MAG TPA: hypothetical protein V6D33_19835 [Cyanophyceae cyanobacterium]
MPYNRVNYDKAYAPDLRTAWAHVLAVAWMREDILDRLRDDPKSTIEGVVRGEILLESYQDQLPYFVAILEHGEGVFGIPNPPLPTERLRRSIGIEQLAQFFDREGLFGIIRGT